MRAFSLSILLLLGVACAPLLAQSAPLDEKQKAVMLFDIRMDLITGSELGKSLGLVDKMSAIPGASSEDGPDPTKMTRVFGAMSAPENIQEAMSVQMGQMPFEFFVRMQFSDAAEVTKMIEKAKEDNGGTVEKNGKTYFKPPEGEGTPPGLMMHAFDDKTLEMGTEAYLFGGTATPFTDGLNAARKNLPKDQAIRLVMDLEGASGLIAEAVGMGQQSADPMTSAYLDLVDNMKNLRIAIDLSSENLLMIGATGKDNDEAQELKEGLDAILELAKGGGNMGIKQAEDSEQIDAEESAVARAILGALEAKIDGTEVSITIPKPKNFDSVVEKAVSKFGGMMMGGGGPPPPR